MSSWTDKDAIKLDKQHGVKCSSKPNVAVDKSAAQTMENPTKGANSECTTVKRKVEFSDVCVVASITNERGESETSENKSESQVNYSERNCPKIPLSNTDLSQLSFPKNISEKTSSVPSATDFCGDVCSKNQKQSLSTKNEQLLLLEEVRSREQINVKSGQNHSESLGASTIGELRNCDINSSEPLVVASNARGKYLSSQPTVNPESNLQLRTEFDQRQENDFQVSIRDFQNQNQMTEKKCKTMTNIVSTFGTMVRPTLLPLEQIEENSPHCVISLSQTAAAEQLRQQKLYKQKQWEAELDLILPVCESNFTGSSCASATTTTTSTSLLHYYQDQQQQEFAETLMPSQNIPDTINCKNNNKRSAQHSRIILVPEPSSFVPDSRTGSSLHLSQQFQFTPTITTISTSSTTENLKGGSGRRRLFDGIELDIRQICIVCGFLIVAAAVGVGVGVPIALQIQSHQRKDGFKHEIVRKVLSEVPLIDGHNDLAWNLRKFLQNQLTELNFDQDLRQFEPFAGSAWSHTDLTRLHQGRVGTQLWSAYVPCEAQHLDGVQIVMEQIDVIKRLVDKYHNSLSLITSVQDIETAHLRNKIGSLISVEGGHVIGNSLAVLRVLYDLGTRSLTLTHNCNTPWADSASNEHYLPDRGGLTEFGKLVILESNRLGIIIDLAHVSVQTMKDALQVSRAPVIFSHSAASALCNHSRNVPDEILKYVAINGGLVMISFYNVFIACNETARIDDVIAHIEHLRTVAGIDHVGIGAGYDGINFVPSGLEDVSKYPNLIERLYSKNAWTELDLKKLAGLNFIRVFRQVETVRDEWRRLGIGPIEEWIPKNELKGHPLTCSYHGSS